MSVDLVFVLLIGCGLVIKLTLKKVETDLKSLDQPQGTIDR